MEYNRIRGGRRVVAAAASCLLALGLSACGGDSDSESADGQETLQVAITPGLMPYVGDEDGALTGLDGELFTKAAEDLGLDIEVSTVQFSALLAGVQSGRYDAGLGNVAWKADRAESGLFTDPPYYSPIAVAAAPGQSFTDIASLEGHNVGSLSGDIFGPALRSLPGTNVRAYPDINAALADVVAGRVDAVVADALSLANYKKERPDADYTVQTLTPASAAQVQANSELSGLRPYMTGWYLDKSNEELSTQLTEKIRGYYTDGTLNEIVAKWGGEPKSMLTPDPDFAAERIAVDRPEGWTPPTYQP
ncbi:substrate-binding periplasmic protein [Mycolicibacterium litorale]|uniref:substrate-binding periplasmic protein n=1 Tax=Mycolicibacterium litorale TaxID=758802 RepID=UPI003CEFE8BD